MKKYSLARLQREAQLPVSTARRYWHSSSSGLVRDMGTLASVGLAELGRIARVLGVAPAELLTRIPLGEAQGDDQLHPDIGSAD